MPEPGAVLAASTQNLWYMRQFYHEYSAAPKLQPLVGEIGWAHNLLILSRCKDTQGQSVDGIRKTAWDLIGASVALAGMAVVMFAPQNT